MKFMKYPSLRHGHMSKGLILLAQMTSALLVLEVARNTHPCVIIHIFNVPFATLQVSYSQGDKYFCLRQLRTDISLVLDF